MPWEQVERRCFLDSAWNGDVTVEFHTNISCFVQREPRKRGRDWVREWGERASLLVFLFVEIKDSSWSCSVEALVVRGTGPVLQMEASWVFNGYVTRNIRRLAFVLSPSVSFRPCRNGTTSKIYLAWLNRPDTADRLSNSVSSGEWWGLSVALLLHSSLLMLSILIFLKGKSMDLSNKM